jgi:NO-binding membrane sensor protein with MHYT domain
VGNYLGLVIITIALLVGFMLAFAALTIIWRRHWEILGATESLLARLAVAVLVGLFVIANGQAPFYAAMTVLQPDRGVPLPADTVYGRNQAVAVVAVALALTVIGVLRIELYHRRATGISHRDETDDEWRTEEPEPTRAPRGGRS